MFTIGVTGASGFIGANLIRYLTDKHHNVFTLYHPWHEPDFHRCNAIVHLGAINRAAPDSDMFQANVQGTMALIHHALENGTRLAIAGSTYTHGMFGSTKKICRTAVKHLSPGYVDATYVELPHVFGPHCRPFYNSFVSTIMHCMATGEDYRARVKSMQTPLDLIHVSDVCRVFERMATTPIHDLIEEEADRGAFPLPPVYRMSHEGQFRMSIKDFISIAEGKDLQQHSQKAHEQIRDTLQWYRANAS